MVAGLPGKTGDKSPLPFFGGGLFYYPKETGQNILSMLI
jgi:hypothetical protein